LGRPIPKIALGRVPYECRASALQVIRALQVCED